MKYIINRLDIFRLICYIAKLRIFSEVHKLEKNFQAVDAEDAAVTDATAFAGGKDFDIAPTSVKIVA